MYKYHFEIGTGFYPVYAVSFEHSELFPQKEFEEKVRAAFTKAESSWYSQDVAVESILFDPDTEGLIFEEFERHMQDLGFTVINDAPHVQWVVPTPYSSDWQSTTT